MKKHLSALLLLTIAICLAYSNSINGTWALDDYLVNRPVGINHLRDLVGFRKIAYLTFLLNQSLTGVSSASFRLFNIGLHILNVFLVYLLAWKTIKPVPGKTNITDRVSTALDTKAFYAAFISGAVFGLHPLNINAVTYIVQRMASLASLFVLLALLSYISASQTAHRLKKFSMYGLSAVFIVIGIFSKENAVMAVPLILLYDYVFLSGQDNKVFLKKLAGLAGIFILLIAPVSYFLKFHSTFINIARTLLNFNQPIKASVWTAADVYWTPLQHILTEFRIITRYLLLVIAPLPQFLVFDWWGFSVSKGFMDPGTTLLSAVVLSSLLVFSVWKIKRFPLLCFGILWYLIAISLESFFAVGSDLYFEHRNYLPLTGLFIGIIGQVTLMINRESVVKRLWIAAALICLILGSMTYIRNYVWKDSVALWGDTVSKTQGNLRAIIALGNSYVKRSDFVTARKLYIEAVEAGEKAKVSFFVSESLFSLGMAELFLGDLEEAGKTISLMAIKSANNNKTDILKGFYSSLAGDNETALSILYKALPYAGELDRVVVYTLIGDTYRRKGMPDEAMNNYREALKVDPVFSAAYYGIGSSYLRAGKSDDAIEYLKKTLAIDPDNVLALSDMADIMLINKEPVDRAYEYAERAVSLAPSLYQPYLMMGNVMLVKGEEKLAEGFYWQAAEHRAANYRIAFSKARAWYLRGDRERAIYYMERCLALPDLPPDFKQTAQQGLRELKDN